MEKTGNILIKYIPKNMKRVDLAEKLGVKEQYLSNVLNDIKKPSNKFLDKYIKLFNVSEKDIEAIKKYELFRKVPDSIRGEVIEISQNFTKFKTLYIKNMGTLKDEKYVKSNNDEILTLKNNMIFRKIGEANFFVSIDTDKYSPFFKDDVIFFKSDFLYKDLDNKYVLAKYMNKTSIYLFNIIDNKMILNSLVKDEKSHILTNKKNLKVYGYAYTRISEELL